MKAKTIRICLAVVLILSILFGIYYYMNYNPKMEYHEGTLVRNMKQMKDKIWT